MSGRLATRIRLGRIASAALSALAIGLAVPAVEQAQAKPKAPGNPTVGCSWQGGVASPGQYLEVRQYIYLNGQRVGYTTSLEICGEDGNWHEVIDRVAQPPQTTVVVTSLPPGVTG